jgi:hypothetical protein
MKRMIGMGEGFFIKGEFCIARKEGYNEKAWYSNKLPHCSHL